MRGAVLRGSAGWRRWGWGALLSLGLAGAVAVVAAPAPRPSTFFGAVTVGGEAVAGGTPVSAWVGGVPFAETVTFEVGGEAVFRLDVPGDVAETAAVEGGVEGQEVAFRVGNAIAAEVGVWSDGTVARVDLSATAGPDLAIAKDDGAASADPGDLLTYTIVVTNHGPGSASGIEIEDSLPIGTAFVAASDGGALSGGVVAWAPFDLAQGASATRTLTLEVATSFPAGTTEIANTASVLDDGAAGLDPDLANNVATDTDALAGGPDLVVGKSADLAAATPGDDIVYTLTVENRGFQPALGVVLADTLPPEVLFLTASEDGRAVAGVVTWPPLDLAVGEVVSRTVRVRVPADVPPEIAELVNLAEAPFAGDLQPADNAFTHLLPVAQETDLAVAAVDVSAMITDLQTLAVSGEVAVELANLGNGAAAGFDLAVFEDRDGDEAYTAGADALLGTLPVALLAAGETATLAVPVAGTVLFRDNRVFAFADAGDVLAERDETNNVEHSGHACQAVPPPGPFSPEVELSWPLPDTADAFSADSLSTPLVVQLTDDNGDGRWDERDVPDLVFVTYDLSNPFSPVPRLRAIRGDTGADLWTIFPPISGLLQTFAFSGLAAGDIDLDGRPEIVVSTISIEGPTGRPNRIAAYEHTGAFKWISPSYSTHPDGDSGTNSDNPTIADLDGDGRPEIVVGGHAFEANGALRWRGTGGQAYQSGRNADGLNSGAISIVADLDLDGTPEVVTGNTAYRSDGTIWWQVPLDDGYPAVGDFDGDDFPEIVVVARGRVRLHEHDGTLIWTAELPGAGAEPGGAPTVANVDADPEPEIGVAGSTQYAVFEGDGSVKWQSAIQDGSSGFTGSTVFDLDGDGRFEVIYRDETALRIYRGEDGVVLYHLPLSSVTLNEQPVVADVDRDGNAEIVVTSDLGEGQSVPVRTRGLRVIGDAGDRWVAARPVWNQHAYHIGNVAEDGHSVPAREEPSWLAHNTYRANLPPAAGAFASPDLTASRLAVDLAAFPTVRATARVGNGGTTFVAAGLSVALYDADPAAGGALLGVATVPHDLDPGAFADLSLDFPAAGLGAAELFARADDDGTGAGAATECDESNNLHGIAWDTDALGLALELEDGTDAVQPGEVFTYQLTVANGSLVARTGVALAHTLSPHVAVVAASDGGTEGGGTVSWPPFELAATATAVRTLTLQVDPALPLGVAELTNAATVADDGSHGPDATPGNNADTDTNRVLTVRAEAGGPYAGDEGAAIAFDGAASSDRDGTVVAWEWDFDGDGLFEASGVTASHAFPDDGTFTVALRVTDDSGERDVDTAEVIVANLSPAVEAGPDQALVEGDATTLVATTIADPGAADTHTATIDWGDGGPPSAGVVDPATGSVAGGHDYPDDGVFPVTVCATDDDGATACDGFTVTVANAPPAVAQDGDVDLRSWQAEDIPDTTLVAAWQVAPDGLSVFQAVNSDASFFFGDFLATGVRLEGKIRVETAADDDFIGFALGFQPGDTRNPEADFLLIDWKKGNQSTTQPCVGTRTMPRGLAVSRTRGLPQSAFYSLHLTDPCDPAGPVSGELARGRTRGGVGWQTNVEYLFTIDLQPDRLQVWVNGTLEFDLAGDFDLGAGRFAFYNFSQERVRYSTFRTVGLGLAEGQEGELRALFQDLGVVDTHTATIDWADGTVSEGEVTGGGGSGTVSGRHTYLDDAAVDVEVCVEDDDGGVGCGAVPATVANLAPVVDAGGDRLAYLGEGLTLAAAFTDAGVLDTHTATIDWGDGSVEAGAVSGGGGSGAVGGFHVYAEEGAYTVEVCVADDDGGSGCDRFEVLWRAPRLDLALSKEATVATVRPGEPFAYVLTVRNLGTREPEGVAVTDVLPAHLDFVGASHGGAFEPASRTVTWTLPRVAFEAVVPLTLTVTAAATLPPGETLVNQATVSDDGRFGPDLDPTNDAASAAVRTWDGVAPRVHLPAQAATEGVEHSLAVRFDDPLAAVAAAALPSDGLVAHWPFDDLRDPTLDASGNAHFATLGSAIGADANDPATVCVSPLAPLAGNLCALDFTGRLTAASDDFVRVPTAGGLDITGAYTVSAWVRLDSTVDHRPLFVRGADDGVTDANDIEIYSQGSSRDLVVLHNRGNGGPLAFVGFRDPPAGRLFHLAVSFDGSEVRAYYDGVAQPITQHDAILEPPLSTAEAWLFGKVNHAQFASGTARTKFLDGLLDDVRFYARALAPAEVQALAAASGGGGESHTATVDWGDGTAEPATVLPGGFVTASHLYPDDLSTEIEVCVTDSAGHAGCSQAPLAVENFVPAVVPSGGQVVDEGSPVTMTATFTDSGRADTHSAAVDWRDGSTESLPVAFDPATGTGSLGAGHPYADDGRYEAAVCVTDDDGGTGCGTFPTVVRNVAPVVAAGPDRQVAVGEPLELLATFTDQGVLDTHTASFDWGEGAPPQAVAVTQGAGSGSATATHVYSQAGFRLISACVVDDDGGRGCDIVEVEVVGVPRPDLVVTAIDAAGVTTDPLTLAAAGTVAVTVANRGDEDVPAPFRLAVFDDADGDGRLGPSDALAGEVEVPALPVGGEAALAVPVAFTAAFAGDLLYAFADSAGEIAESDEANNIAHTGAFCEYRPPVGTFDPVLEWSWTGSPDVEPAYSQVIVTPLVGDLSGDGVPDIVFSSRSDLSGNCLLPGVVRAISGDGSGSLWDVADPALRSQSCAELSMGDIDGDQLPEVLYQRYSPNGIVALEHTGEVKWFWAGQGGATAIANLDGRGLPEIVVGAQVLNADGTLRWRAPDFSPTRAATLATVADLDLDGTAEITSGDRAWNHDGSLFFDSGVPISYTAVGNFDDDDFPEIVAVSSGAAGGTIRLLEHDGTVKWSITPFGIVEGGAPTVADYDGDGLPEVGVAGASRYVVIDTDGTLLWSRPTVDSSSRITSSSVFDFEGDGRAEVVYNDHNFLRVYRGSDGAELFRTANSSCTATENPVVADVDGDGEAEIVVARNRMCGLGSAAAGQGIFVYGDASGSWVATRKVWNQHTYHVTNVTDHLTIPLVEAPSWLPPGPNGFRQQVLVQGNPLAAPDLTVSGLRVETAGCPGAVGIVARVGNGGSKAAPAGVGVLFHAGDPAAGGTLLGAAATTVALAPGEHQDVTFSLPPSGGGPARICVEVDPAATVGECNEQNVVCVDLATSCAPPALAATKTDALGLDHDGDGDVEPGDRVRYEIVVANVGGGVATGVAVADPIPAHTALVAGSAAASQGTVTAGEGAPLTVALGTLAAGAAATVSFEVEIATPPPAGLTEVANQATVTSVELPPVLSDDPDAPGAADPTVTPVLVTPLVTVDDVTVEEGDGEAVFTVRLSTPAPRPAAVGYATADGTAAAGEDYTATTGRLELPAGAAAGQVAVPIVDDLVLEADAETFRLLLAEPEGVEIVDGEGEATILDDELCPGPNLLANGGAEERVFGTDATPGWTLAEGPFLRLATAEAFEGGAVFAAGFAAAGEGAAGEGPDRALLVQDVDLSAYAGRIASGEQLFAFTAVVRTGAGGAGETARLRVEYRDEAGTAVLDAYDSGDLASPEEWLRVTDVRPAPAGARSVRVTMEATRFGDGAGSVWADAAELRSLRAPALAIGDVAVPEGDAGTTDAVFAATLSCPYWQTVTVDYATADGLARAVEDYLAGAGTLSFPSGDTVRELAVPVVGDEVHERHEDFTVGLANAAPAEVVLADAEGTGLILNDDFCPRSPGFWKTHPELWPTDHLALGGVEHGTAALAAFLDASGSDATLTLARQLVATKLNLLVGSDPFILPTVAAADAFLAEHPPGSNPRGAARQEANALKDALDRYNNLDCQEVPVVPE